MTDTHGPKPNRLETIALFQEVAGRTAIPVDTIRSVIETFTDVITEALIKEEKVVLRHFGTFEARRSTGRLGGVRIRFKPSAHFKGPVKEALKPMDKLGVTLDGEASLLAKMTGECPSCNEALTSRDPPQCPNCGTTPFESRPIKASSMKNFDVLYGKKEE